MSPDNLKEAVKKVTRIRKPHQARLMYESITSKVETPHTYFLLGTGGKDDFNDGFEPHYIKEYKKYNTISLSQPIQDGETREVDTDPDEVIRLIEENPTKTKKAIIYENSIESGKSVIGAVRYILTTDISDYFDKIYVAATRDSKGLSNFCLYQLFTDDENTGLIQKIEKEFPEAYGEMGDNISKLENNLIFGGDLPISAYSNRWYNNPERFDITLPFKKIWFLFASKKKNGVTNKEYFDEINNLIGDRDV